MDYYFFVGDHVAHVLNELTQLTGRTLLKPKYIFGYHQGGYGPNYNNKWSLMQVALQYREAKIPCDGMHVDVDFQNNYRTFTHSPTKFPNPKEFFSALHDWGYKVKGYILHELVLRNMFHSRNGLEEGSTPVPDYLGVNGGICPRPQLKSLFTGPRKTMYKKFLSLWGFQIT